MKIYALDRRSAVTDYTSKDALKGAPCGEEFEFSCSRHEYFVIQLVIDPLYTRRGVSVATGDLIPASGGKPIERCVTCFNTSGVLPNGEKYTKTFNLTKGVLQPLYFGVNFIKADNDEYSTYVSVGEAIKKLPHTPGEPRYATEATCTQEGYTGNIYCAVCGEWLENGDVWLSPRMEDTFTVKFGGRIEERWQEDRLYVEQKDCYTVEAIPYDMNISGYDVPAVNKLRLWTAKAPVDFDMKLFAEGEYVKSLEQKALAESICKVLYPADHHQEGKMLRLKQQYFFVSASIQSILKKHLKDYKTIDSLPDKVAIHINDTHPTLCIPELMRLLLDEYGYTWEKAWDIVKRTISYTNHTVMAEALEKWPEGLFRQLLPRIYQIVCEINRRFTDELWAFYPSDYRFQCLFCILCCF